MGPAAPRLLATRAAANGMTAGAARLPTSPPTTSRDRNLLGNTNTYPPLPSNLALDFLPSHLLI